MVTVMVKRLRDQYEPFAFCAISVCVCVHMHTCCHALALLLRREDFSVSQTAVSDITDPEAEHRVGQKKL